jgi:hypothetical protein
MVCKKREKEEKMQSQEQVLEPDPRYLRYARLIHQYDRKRGKREVLIHIPFSHQFLRDIPNDVTKHRVIMDTLSFLRNFFIKDLELPLQITPILPSIFDPKKKEITGLKISGSRQDIRDIEKYLTRPDVMEFIQQTRRYHKQKQAQLDQMSRIALMESSSSSTQQGKKKDP